MQKEIIAEKTTSIKLLGVASSSSSAGACFFQLQVPMYLARSKTV